MTIIDLARGTRACKATASLVLSNHEVVERRERSHLQFLTALGGVMRDDRIERRQV